MSDLGNKRIMADNIMRFMRLHDKTRRQICNDLNISYTTFTDWVNANTYPRIDKIELLANYFGIEKSDLVERYTQKSNYLNNTNIHPITTQKIPVLGEIRCGEPTLAQEERLLYVMVGTEVKADFALICRGDSMIDARIQDGDIVFIRKQDIVNNGEIAAVIIDDEATLKRFYYYRDKNLIILKPANALYEDIILTGEQLDHVRVLGKAVAFQSDVE